MLSRGFARKNLHDFIVLENWPFISLFGLPHYKFIRYFSSRACHYSDLLLQKTRSRERVCPRLSGDSICLYIGHHIHLTLVGGN